MVVMFRVSFDGWWCVLVLLLLLCGDDFIGRVWFWVGIGVKL